MNKSLRSVIGCLAITFCLGNPLASNAGHLLGADINYTYVGPNQYLVSVRFFRDCLGLPAPMQLSVCYRSANASVSGSVNLNYVPPGIPPYSPYLPPCPYLPPMITSCYGGPGIGIEENFYHGLITLPSAQSDWIVSYSSFPENIGINQNFLYVSAKIDNINTPINSSSIYAPYRPTFIYCINQPAWDNFSSMDSDGDSLSYHYIPIEDNSTLCPHAPFISPIPAFPAIQFMSSTPVTLDSTNGSLTFSPSMVGTTMVAVRVDEHRNGAVINSSTIQHVMYFVTGCIITGIENEIENRSTLYPNPANDFMNIELTQNTIPNVIEVIDVSGKITNLEFRLVKEKTLELDVQSLSQGIYSLRIVSENATEVMRFVKL